MMIEVGMMVEIVDAPDFVTSRELIGHVGMVLGRHEDGSNYWIIEGAEIDPADGLRTSFYAGHLKPIDDKASWEADIWQQIGWKPILKCLPKPEVV